MSIKDMTVDQLKEVVEGSKTVDGRIAPDYAESFQLAEAIDELIERAWMYEGLES